MINITVLKAHDSNIEIAGFEPKNAVGVVQSVQVINEKGESLPMTFFPMPYRDVINEKGELEATVKGFRAKLPVYNGARYHFLLVRESAENGRWEKKQEIKFGRHSGLQNLPGSHIISDEHIISCQKNEINVTKASLFEKIRFERAFNKQIKEDGKEYLLPFRKKAKEGSRSSKPTVIISDRVNMARDNGEALFKYLMANGYDQNFDLYFAVLKESEDYERMSQYGKVLDFGSDEYKEKFLIADKIISSGFDFWFSNAFGDDYKYMTDLYHFDHYFLQHGVIMNDLSKSLNYTRQGFRLFCTTTEREYKAILGESYGYAPDEVRLTGLPRYDYLEDEAEKLIVIAPTWRADLAGEADPEHGSRFYSEKLRDSDYFAFYNDLINNRELIEAMKEKGYRGEFYLHPSFIANYSDFKGNETIEVCADADYNRIFRKASILVTDYSSINMDFAYLGKPVIYSQYDKDTFFERHFCGTGYFDYEKDGFGPVCITVEQVADSIISLISSGCRTDDVYSERAEKFFKYRDKENCKRVAEAIFG